VTRGGSLTKRGAGVLERKKKAGAGEVWLAVVIWRHNKREEWSQQDTGAQRKGRKERKRVKEKREGRKEQRKKEKRKKKWKKRSIPRHLPREKPWGDKKREYFRRGAKWALREKDTPSIVGRERTKKGQIPVKKEGWAKREEG